MSNFSLFQITYNIIIIIIISEFKNLSQITFFLLLEHKIEQYT